MGQLIAGESAQVPWNVPDDGWKYRGSNRVSTFYVPSELWTGAKPLWAS